MVGGWWAPYQLCIYAWNSFTDCLFFFFFFGGGGGANHAIVMHMPTLLQDKQHL